MENLHGIAITLGYPRFFHCLSYVSKFRSNWETLSTLSALIPTGELLFLHQTYSAGPSGYTLIRLRSIVVRPLKAETFIMSPWRVPMSSNKDFTSCPPSISRFLDQSCLFS